MSLEPSPMNSRIRPFDPSKVPLPPNFRSLDYVTTKALDIEIGCGVGLHPLRYARENPERQIIAFERTTEKFAKFSGRLAHHPTLPNLTAIHGDAISWITHGVRLSSVDKYFVLYPNPYPKQSQSNLRFHEMPFFSHLLATLKVGGTLTIASNTEFYIKDANLRCTQYWGMECVELELLPSSAIPRTHFEKKYLARNECCWNLVLRRS